MSEDKKVSTSEMVGELRRAARLYKSFEKANEIADVLLGHEKSIKSLEKSIGLLETEKKSLDDDCNDIVNKITEKEVEVEKLSQVISNKLKGANDEAEGIVNEAKSTATQIVRDAESRLESVKIEIKAATSKREEALGATSVAESELEKMNGKIQQMKDKLISSFN